MQSNEMRDRFTNGNFVTIYKYLVSNSTEVRSQHDHYISVILELTICSHKYKNQYMKSRFRIPSTTFVWPLAQQSPILNTALWPEIFRNLVYAKKHNIYTSKFEDSYSINPDSTNRVFLQCLHENAENRPSCH